MELSRKAMGIKPSSTMEISSKAAQLRAEGKDVVAFAAGEPDLIRRNTSVRQEHAQSKQA